MDRKKNALWANPEVDTRISAYEMAFRMQSSVPGLMDVSDEPSSALELYGAKPGDGSYASNCLLARRLVERGVPILSENRVLFDFVHLYHRGWDHHGGLANYMKICCGLTDRPTWALLTDLKQRGLLEDTLVIWGGEFGRTPMFQGKGGAGRDHHIKGFSMWMAGGGIKGGVSHGATDELGYHAEKGVPSRSPPVRQQPRQARKLAWSAIYMPPCSISSESTTKISVSNTRVWTCA